MEYKLIELSANDGIEIYEMLQELPSDENGYMNSIYGKTYDEYRNWLVRSVDMSKGIGLEDWMVPQTTYWFYVDETLVGVARIRHYLTDALRLGGGHGGYSIRPSERSKGYGTILLSLMLEEAKKLHIDRMLLTVQNHNIPSINVALKNGGIIEQENEERKYIWIDL
jgi:predicted acetyltransferase